MQARGLDFSSDDHCDFRFAGVEFPKCAVAFPTMALSAVHNESGCGRGWRAELASLADIPRIAEGLRLFGDCPFEIVRTAGIALHLAHWHKREFVFADCDCDFLFGDSAADLAGSWSTDHDDGGVHWRVRALWLVDGDAQGRWHGPHGTTGR